MQMSCGEWELRDRENEMKADNKQEKCPHPFIDPLQAQEGEVELPT